MKPPCASVYPSVNGFNDGTYPISIHSDDLLKKGTVLFSPPGQMGESEAREEGWSLPKSHTLSQGLKPLLVPISSVPWACFPIYIMMRMSA